MQGGPLSAAPPTSQWDDLHRQSRKLEETIDNKLMSFSKLGTTFLAGEVSGRASDTKPKVATEHIFTMMSSEIEQLLARLSQLNMRMTHLLQSMPSPPTALSHTLTRHDEILKTLSQDFNKMKVCGLLQAIPMTPIAAD